MLEFDKERFAWDGDRHAVVFFASLDGAPLTCLISGEALQDRFRGAPSREGMVQTFLRNRSTIEEKARELIDAARIEGDRVVIRSRDFALADTTHS